MHFKLLSAIICACTFISCQTKKEPDASSQSATNEANITIGTTESIPRMFCGWDRVLWGMSIAQLDSVYGIKNLLTLKHPEIDAEKREIVLRKLPTFKILHKSFVISFHMNSKDTTLQAVRLTLTPIDRYFLAIADPLFVKFERLLTEKYGKATYTNRSEEPDNSLLSYTSSWITPCTEITLNAYGFTGHTANFGLFFILYKKLGPSERDKL